MVLRHCPTSATGRKKTNMQEDSRHTPSSEAEAQRPQSIFPSFTLARLYLNIILLLA